MAYASYRTGLNILNNRLFTQFGCASLSINYYKPRTINNLTTTFKYLAEPLYSSDILWHRIYSHLKQTHRYLIFLRLRSPVYACTVYKYSQHTSMMLGAVKQCFVAMVMHRSTVSIPPMTLFANTVALLFALCSQNAFVALNVKLPISSNINQPTPFNFLTFSSNYNKLYIPPRPTLIIVL